MTKTRQVYRCPICGNVVEVLHSGAVLSCCGQPMQLMEENATDGAYEKHVPVIEPIEGGYRVKVGSVEHPMMPEHYIEWIELLTPTDVLRHELKPGDTDYGKENKSFLTHLIQTRTTSTHAHCPCFLFILLTNGIRLQM